MRATMIMLFPYQTSAGTVRRIRVSLPRILVDNHRYFLPEDLPPPARDDLRAWLRPKLGKIVHSRSVYTMDFDPARFRSF